MTKLLGGYELPPVVYGILLKVCATLAFMLMATVAKFLADDIPVGETVFFRAFFAFIPIAIVMLQSRADLWSLSTSRPWAHARRSLSGVLAMFTYFAALSMLPLAELTAIGFTSPLIVVVLSPFILGERVGIFRRVTALIGLVGVVIMILPALSTPTGSGTEFLGIGVAFLNAFLVAMTMMFIRMMADSEPSLTIAFYFQLTCTLVSALTLPFAWVTPDLEQFGLLVALGVLGGVGQLCMTAGFHYTPASVLAQFDYVAMIWAVLFGWLFFAELPHVAVYFGAAIVVAAGSVVLWRERQLGLKRQRELADLNPS